MDNELVGSAPHQCRSADVVWTARCRDADREKGGASWCQVESLPRRRFRRVCVRSYVYFVCVCVYMCMCMCMCMCVYIYVYIRILEKKLCTYIYIFVHIYIYIDIYIYMKKKPAKMAEK